MNNSAPNATVCQWPNVVRAGYDCTGVYIGNGLVLTVAHCLEGNNVPGGRVWFGENYHSPTLEIECEEAIPYPNGRHSENPWGAPSYDGIDLAVCILKSEWPGPVAPVMRIGCESNYLNFAFFNLFGPQRPRMTAVGVGCNEVNYNIFPPCVASGQKRFWNTWLDHHFPQAYYNGSTKLVHHTPPWLAGNPLEQGDSGGPLFVRMPDRTWRVIGLFHGESLDSVYWQPVPPFVDWIEEVTNRSIALQPGPRFLSETDAHGSWTDSCNSGAGMGQFCGGAPLIQPPPFPLDRSAPTPQASRHFESWVIEGNPQPQKFGAQLRVNGEPLSIRWAYSSPSNPAQLIADAINCHSILRQKQLLAVVEGSWIKTNAKIEFERIDIPSGSIRRRHFSGYEESWPENIDINGFLTGSWHSSK